MQYDGRMHLIERPDQLVAGCIVRRTNPDGTIEPFSDAIILGRGRCSEEKNPSYKIARPYGYATGTETCCQTPLVWAETYEAYFNSLKSTHVIVCNSKDEPIIFKV